MKWEKVTEDNPAPKTGRMFMAVWYNSDYMSKEYPVWWNTRPGGGWMNWPFKDKEPMLFLLFPNADTYFKENK